MTKVVIPTEEIIQKFEPLAHLFDFYDDGLQGLIRDMVLTADTAGVPSAQVREAFRHALQNTGLINKIMRDYAASPEAQFDYRVGTGSEGIQVEMAAEHIYAVVLEMMSGLFMRAVYEICKQNWDWVGKDLVADVEIFE